MLCEKETRSCSTVFRVGRNGEETKKKAQHLLRVEVEQVKIFRFLEGRPAEGGCISNRIVGS